MHSLHTGRPNLTAVICCILFAASQGCTRARVTELNTPEGPGYELRCSEEAHCTSEADHLCPSGYRTLERDLPAKLRAQCANQSYLEVTCNKGQKECADAAYAQCASSYEIVSYLEDVRLVIRCESGPLP
jgi:hypothetical protein